MAVKTVRKGLNRETRVLLECIRRVRPVNKLFGARPEAQAGTSTGKRGANPGEIPGFNTEYDAAMNVSVNQGLSPLASRATSSGLSAAVNSA